ncbi:hypothetical protein CNYM01_02188 [Colletotrichum nymphaeae SA-01]|uniref:Uncharacterized protein n=1 Tax=Colletotrichum nymphaeae SA-01 TaxID=1460502 RepID=A0A135T9C9_9PEZI|nr:hypothetical protein CNYM01_02188 [Colletotrichum nymphaeae SA-01]
MTKSYPFPQALPTERTQQHQTRTFARPGLPQANIKPAKMYILGNFLYIAVLLINAIAVLSEDRFLARSTSPPNLNPTQQHCRSAPSGEETSQANPPTSLFSVNLSPSSYDPTFGSSNDASVKAKIINLIASVRTLMRST